MRADAARNHRRILAAADRLLAEYGVDFTLDDVAAEADVGVGTVYRRFANKSELIQAIVAGYVAELEEATAAAGRDSDPWRGIVDLLDRTCELVAGNRGFIIATTESEDSVTFFGRFEERSAPAIERLLERARSDGVVRSDLVLADLFAVVTMVHAVAVFTGSVDPDNWRRYFVLLIDGMRPRADLLGTPALTLDQIRQARTIAVAAHPK